MDNKEKDIKNPAIVIGDWHFNSLGMVRSLGEKDIPVIYINLSDGGYAEDSKYTLKTYHAKTQDEVLNCIFMTIEEFGGKPVLFTGCDTAAMYIDNSYDLLADKCFCPGANGKLLHFMNKDIMCDYAKRAGFNIPESITIKINEDGFEKLRNFKLPCIVKPLKSVDGLKADIEVCKTESDRENLIKKLQDKDCIYKELLAQEFVEGKENEMTGYCGCRARGVGTFIFGELKKHREYPINRGSTSYASIKKDITFIDKNILVKFLDMIDYDGIFDFDIKIVDGVPYFIEINLRNGALSYAMTVAGFNIPYTWYKCKTEQAAEKIDFHEVVFMCERDDLNNLIEKNVSLIQWLECIKKSDCLMLFNKQDKKPFENNYGKIATLILSLLAKNAI